MAALKFMISLFAIIASCHASGIGVHPAVRLPIVRYAPFYSFPNTVRSIHAVSPSFPPVAPPFLQPAPVPAVAPAPLFTPAVRSLAPAPVFASPGVPFNPIVRAVAPAPPPAFASYPSFGPAFAPALAPTFQAAPAFPAGPLPVAPAYPALGPAPPAFLTSAPHLAFAKALPHYARIPFVGPPPAVPAAPLFRQPW